VRNHKSNVAELTEWEGDFVFSMNTDVGSHQQTQTVHARFRADVRKWRPEIHKPPVEPDGPPDGIFTATKDSYLDYLCSGQSTFTEDEFTETIIWSGAGRLARGIGENLILPRGWFMTSRNMELQFIYTAPSICTEITISTGSPNHQDTLPLLQVPFYLYFPEDIFQITKIDLNDAYAILSNSDSRELPIDDVPIRLAGTVDSGVNFKLSWDSIEAKHPPDPASPR
jgi:hypothetical protein